jgi:hypothetical protein
MIQMPISEMTESPRPASRLAVRNACHRFVLTEALRPVVCLAPVQALTVATVSAPQRAAIVKPQAQPQTKPPATVAPAQIKVDFPHKLIAEALENSKDKTGWSHLGTFGSHLKKLQPKFDWGRYGPKKLGDFVKARPDVFRIEKRASGGSGANEIYVRAK